MKKIVLFDIDDVLFKTADFIRSGLKHYESYKDSRKTIDDVKKVADVAILSQGEYNFQLDKLNETKLVNLFEKENIFIVKEKSEETKNIFSKFSNKLVFMIDNRLDKLEQIKKLNQNVKTIWIKRGRRIIYNGNFKPDFTVRSLAQIKRII